jgi:hypothetical protein
MKPTRCLYVQTFSCAAFKIKLITGSGNACTCEKLHDRSRIRLPQKAGVCARALRLRLHWSQKRHNTTVWTDSRQGSRNRVAIFHPTCLSRLLATQGLLVLSLLVVSDVNGAWRAGRVMTGTNFCWQIVTFAWSMRTDEDGGCISFGNQELMENTLNCARYWENFLISSENIKEWI